ncbi:Type I Iterative PKS [Lepraria neglecta]|uniref:Type I Iterative PKS n=1 Tax=Lepraria neglecta TaxID=209136 RepID=A0AAD9ZJE3_9LECA|nr:Type I Iterative PKS [Lepraria neglecta]
MYALHLAVSAIRNGDCDGAIVAAANWISDPSMQIVLDKLGALSPTSRCHTFDVSADGYARGEGFVALYLKKSSVAVLDGLPIRAMIRGTAVNANGKTGGITRPSARGQEDAIRKAYENAGNLPFSDTTFFECHGTGTPAGDPLEVSAAGNVFASSRSNAPEDRLLIGSIKPNLGHTEGASALASIMKVVLSLEAGEVPPTYGVEKLNPNIDFEGAKVLVVKDGTVPWPEGKLRRASVNSFGFGGANGHCIIDHVNNVLPGYVRPGIIGSLPVNGQSTNGNLNGYSNGQLENGLSNGSGNFKLNGVSTPTPPSTPPHHSPVTSAAKKVASAKASTRQLVLLPFSAHNASSLKLNIDALSQVIDQLSLADIAYTLGCKRSRLQQRSFRIVDKDDLALGLAAEKRIFTSPIQASNVAYVFTGQGAQWHAMGAQLFDYGIFRATISYLDYLLKELPDCPSWTISATLSGAYEPEHIQSPKVSQVVCTAVQIAIVDLLASWSVRPVAVVGHSSGEMAAAYASGHITAAEAITAAYFRGQAVSKNKRKGAMLAVGLGADQVSGYIQGKEEQVRIAAMNSPGSVTLSGDADAIEALSAILTKDNVFNRVLRTCGSAYHSHHMLAVGGDYTDMLHSGAERIKKLGLVDETQRYPRIPWASSVKPDKVIADGDLAAHYWRANLESPVRFTQAVTKMMSLENGTAIDVLIEIGPHAALKGPLEQILKGIGKPAQYVPSLQRNEDGRNSLLQLAGTLFATNAEIDLAAVNSVDGAFEGKRILTHGCTAVDLPTYQYTYGSVSYYESRVSKEYRLREIVRHDLLGSEVPGASKLQPQWRNVLRAKDVPWLSDHRLLPDAVFPAAGFIALGVEAATRVYHDLPDALEITGYSFRKVDIDTALRIPEDDYGIEIIFSMELVDTATAKSPAWAKFAVTSVARDSNEWTQHCTGLVKVEVSPPAEKDKISAEMDPRFPSPQAWYDKFTEIGLGYGETFRPLSEIQVDPHRNLAKATVALNKTAGTIKGGESSYPLHPTALDATFQLAIIAFYGGQVEKANAAFVPVHLSQLYLKAGVRQDWGRAIARGSIQGLRSAYAQLQMMDPSGDVFLEVDSMRFTSFKESKLTKEMQSRQPFSSPFTRLVWKPDIRTLNNRQVRELFPPPTENAEGAAALEIVDMICCLVVFEIYGTFISGGTGPCPKGDIRHWLAWMKRIVEEDQRPNMVEARKLSPDQRRQLLQKLHDEAGDRPEAKAAKLLHENVGEILNERRTGIDVLVSDKLLTPLYETGHAIAGSHPQVFNIMDCLGHANPNLRILEIGAGTGAATRAAMKALVGPNGIKRYADYTFTDISAGFLTSAKDMLSDYRDVNYSVLDIEQNPMENGYEPAYDVVLTCEAIHATASMDRTLAHCRSLLKPGGKLVLVETTRMRVLLGLLYGTLTGYWQSDGRTEGPFMNLQTWQRRLRENGFSGTDLVLDDYHAPHNTTSVLVTTRVEEQDAESPTQSAEQEAGVIYLLHDTHSAPPLSGQIAAEFERHGATCKAFPLDGAVEAVPANARVVAFLSSKNDLFDADEHRLKSFQHLARNVQSMLWLTPGGIVKGQNPRGAFMTGLLRVITTENPAGRFLSINTEGDNFERGNDDLVRGIVNNEFALQAEELGEGSIDGEFAWQDGCMRVSRVVPDAGLGEYSETIKTPTRQGFQMLPIDSHGPVRAAFETAGILNSLYFRPYTAFLQPLPVNYVDVKVAAVGLSWKDVTLATGRNNAASSNLSSEYAGVVTEVGAKVAGLSVGDRVYGVGKGHFGNYERVPAAFAQKLQPTDDFIEAATMPLVYMSAVYAFEYVARLRKGHKVLIQSATGGLGLAAIQVARSRGAEIFTTVGTSDKVSFLADTVGIPIDHIFSSRDPEALSRAARATGKGGFDVILSTVVGGDSLYQSLKALAPMGHLIDVGRVDVLESKEMGLELFQKNANFSSFDLNVVLDNDPELGGQLMKTVNELHQTGRIAPIHPLSVSDVSELDQTLLSFSRGTHIGKLVVSFQNPNSIIKLLRQPQTATFDPEARYIITGGLGGLGRSILRWMVDRGAHDFVVLSRRGASTLAAQVLLDDLKARGVRIEAIACDVSKREKVVQVIHKVSAANRPVKGVVNAVLSLSDLSFDKLTIDQWRSGIAAKTQGSVNLHEATIALPLDFFVMLTSTETIWAPPTQAAYIAADNFAAYFARYRRRLGLPASTVSYGFVSDVGSDYRETSHGTEDMYARNLASTMTEHQALAALEPAFLDSQGRSQWIGQQHDPLSAATFFTCLNPIDLAGMISTNVPRWHRDGRVSLIMRAMNDARRHALTSAEDGIDGDADDSASGTARLRRAFDDAIKAGPDARATTVELVTDGIAKTIAEMLFIDAGNVNPSKSVAEHGVDSLIAAELRNWFHQALRTKLQNLLDSQTSIKMLAEQIVDKALSG